MDNDKFNPEADASGARSTPNEIVARAGELAHETLEQAERLGATVRQRVVRQADEKKAVIARKLDDFARNLSSAGAGAAGEDDLQRKIVDRATRVVQRVSRALDENTTEELIAGAGRQIRERPGLFLAGCLALGFLGGRLLRR